MLVAVARAGADVLEIGVPFSDPLADGPVIQRAIERALAARHDAARRRSSSSRRVRAEVDTPIVLFTYANPVLRMEPAAFARAAADAGVDGVLILDYPVEEAEPLREPLVDAGLDPIFLVSPTTTDDADPEVGGARTRVPLRDLAARRHRHARQLRGGRRRRCWRACAPCAALPVAVGFGISSPEHVAEACRVADAAVVGSALVDTIAQHAAAGNVCARASEYVRVAEEAACKRARSICASASTSSTSSWCAC